jgi:SAM-dependent methyltransferase
VTLPGPQTWHYGLIADWWAEFNLDGPEIEYFGRFVERGQPVLDAGCGAGRLLVPWLRAGYDVDGCDMSGDMIERCRRRARAEGFDPVLLVQPLHELDAPRRYRTIVACGVLGLGSTRKQDEQALRRFHESLESGGTLLIDVEAPWSNPRIWPQWRNDDRARLPEPWREPHERERAADGSEWQLRTRTLGIDPLDQTVTLGIRAEKFRGGEPVAAEERALSMRLYFRDELLLLLERAGFGDVDVRGGYTDEAPTADHETLVFVARA